MVRMAKNKALQEASKAKKDEFYTQLSDIEKELRHYKDFFKGKTVFCNCDDPYESNFFKYFAMNFNMLGLKKLIATSYFSSQVSNNELKYYVAVSGQIAFEPFENTVALQNEKYPCVIEITEVTDANGDGRVDLADVEYLLKNGKNFFAPLKGNGDFRSDECVELLKEADVVVTNPPFSLFREYVAQLIKYNKKFLIIGNQNAVTYKEFFPLIKSGQVWLGCSIHSGDREFRVPDNYPLNAAGYRIDEQGNKYIRVKGVRWYTNIDYTERHEDLILFRHYSPELYPKYDNYDAIEVSKTSDIPCDYYGVMGVPITFLDKYSPEQFEILGNSGEFAEALVTTEGKIKKNPGRFYINGKRMYDRLVIKRKVQTNED